MATATTIEGKIVLALEGYFLDVELPANCGISAPGVPYTPDGTNPYVKLTVAHNTPLTVAMSGNREPIRQGILLLVVVWPTGSGILAPTELAAKLRTAFKLNTKIPFDGGYIKICDEPVVQGDVGDGVNIEIPVVIRWMAFS